MEKKKKKVDVSVDYGNKNVQNSSNISISEGNTPSNIYAINNPPIVPEVNNPTTSDKQTTTRMNTTMTGMLLYTAKNENIGSFIPIKDVGEISQQKVSNMAVVNC